MKLFSTSLLALAVVVSSSVAAFAQVPGSVNTPAPAGSPVGAPSTESSPTASSAPMMSHGMMSHGMMSHGMMSPSPMMSPGAMSHHMHGMMSPESKPATGSKSMIKMHGKQAMVRLRPQNGSGETGRADIYQVGDGLRVLLKVKHGPLTAQLAHIHMGTCATLNPSPAFALKPVVGGTSTTYLADLRLATLLAQPFAINVHASAANLKKYVACGNILSAKHMKHVKHHNHDSMMKSGS